MTFRISLFQDGRSFQLFPLVSLLVDSYAWNKIHQNKYIRTFESLAKSHILNVKIRLLVMEYALMIKLAGVAISAHSFNPYAYLGHSWSYFDIQNLRLAILYINSSKVIKSRGCQIIGSKMSFVEIASFCELNINSANL